MRAVTAFALLCLSAPARAAEITAASTPDTRPALLIEGPIVEGDQYKLDQVWAQNPKAQVVILNSPGGLIVPSLRMKEAIRRGGLATVVMPGELCASACGDIWLAGDHRILLEGAKVGVYGNDSKTLTMVGAGNALVGAYVARLGYSDSTVVLATAERPEGMAWITSKDLVNSAGLSFETVPPKELRAPKVWVDGVERPSEVPHAPKPVAAEVRPRLKPLPKPPAPISASE